MLPKSWNIEYTDGTVKIVEADNVSPSGTLLMFIKQTGVVGPKGEMPGYPVHFVDLNNPTVRGVSANCEQGEGKPALHSV